MTMNHTSAQPSPWNTPDGLHAIATATDDDRRRLWRALCAAPPDADVAEEATAAVNVALRGWRPEQRCAPLSCYAVYETVDATGPHDPSFDIVTSLLAAPRWPWPISASASFADQGVTTAALATVAPEALAHLQDLSFAAHGDALPTIARLLRGAVRAQSVSLTGTGVSAHDVEGVLQALPTTVTSLTLANIGGLADVLGRLLVARPQLSALQLQSCRLSADGIAHLVDAGAFDHLQRLRLLHAGLDDEAARRWALRPSPGRLRDVDLEDEGLSRPHIADGFIALVDSGWLSGLSSLRLAYHALTGARLARFLGADVSRLRRLKFWCTGLRNSDAHLLLEAQATWPELGVELSYQSVDAALEARLRRPG